MPDKLLDREIGVRDAVVKNFVGKLLDRKDGFKVRDLEGICLPPYEDCTDCWQRGQCTGSEWQKVWGDLQDNPDKYWK